MGLDDVPRPVLAVVATTSIVWALVVALRAWLRSRRRRRRFARAASGEREAVPLLEGRGFTVEAAQVVATYELVVDGKPVVASVRADYVVRRGARRFVAEVKTGRVAPSLATPATRRQLLEYQHAFGVTGVLLVDADARTVRRIDFRGPRPSNVLPWVAVAVLLASGATWMLTVPAEAGCPGASFVPGRDDPVRIAPATRPGRSMKIP